MHKINKVELRSLQLEDYTQLSQSFKRVYADKDVFWTRKQIETLIRIFPEGQVVTLVDDRIVGCASGLPGPPAGPPYVRVPEGAVREVEPEGDHVRRTYPELL